MYAVHFICLIHTVKRFHSFVFLLFPNGCVFILLPRWTRKAHAVPNWPACWCNINHCAKAIPPCAGTCASFLLGDAAPQLPQRSHREGSLSSTEKDQGEDSAWDLFFHTPAVSGFETEINALSWKTLLCALSTPFVALMLQSIRIFPRF